MSQIPNKINQKLLSRFVVSNNTFSRAVKDNPKDKIELEIGDSKQPDFKPQAKISRWNNEVNFSIRAEEHPEAQVRTEGKLIKYITPEYEVHQYELDPGDIGEDGGLEFEWVLPKKPASNVLRATIQTKELNFFYQPPLTQEEIDQGAERPENVVGSYAVYHKTKGGMNRADGMEYKTGKAFHIYRPKVKDANGNEVWGELNIDEQKGELTVTIDQTWLDNAAYPVVVDPTFGYTSIGVSVNGPVATTRFGETFVTGMLYTLSESANVSSISAHVAMQNKTYGGVNLKGLIYSNNGGHINSRLSSSESGTAIPNSTTYAWRTSNVTCNGLSATDYYISLLGDGSGGNLFIHYDSDASYEIRASTNASDSYTSPPSSIASDYQRFSSNKASIYATYTASATVSVNADVLSLSSGVQAPTVTAENDTWYNADWPHRIKLTIDNTKVGGDLTNYPVYVDLSDLPAFFHDNVKSDGSDIRVTKSDGVSELPREVVSYVAASDTGELHFQYTGTLSGSSDTDVYIYFGNSGASDYARDATYGSENVWGSDYQLVAHLSESGNGTADEYIDSTANLNHGQGGAGQAGKIPAQATGQIENGQDLDGSNDYISFGQISSMVSLSQMTVSLWFRWDGTADNMGSSVWIVGVGHPGEADTEAFAAGGGWDGSHNKGRFYFKSASSSWQSSGDTTANIADGSLHKLDYVYDGTNLKVYVDGQESASANIGSHTSASGTGHFITGGHIDPTGPDYEETEKVNGLVDELRALTVYKDGNWLVTEYNNQKTPSTFYSLGSAESATTTGATNVTVNASELVLSTSLPTATITTTSTVNVSPDSLSLNVSLPTPTITTVLNVNLTPDTLDLSVILPSSGVSIGDGATPAVLTQTFSIPSPTLTAVKNVSVNAGVLSQTFSLPTASVSSSTDVVLTPSQLDIAASIPSPTISVVKNVSIAPTTLTNSFSVPSVGISIGDTTTPAVLSQTFTIPSPTVTAVYNVSVSADVVAATSSIPSPTVSVVRNISVSPNSLALAFSIPAETVVAEGGYLKNSPFYLSIGGGLSIMLGGQRIPVWNTQNRPTGKSGLVGYNREAGKLEIYDGAAWQTITVD